jgi:hypothetical protein
MPDYAALWAYTWTPPRFAPYSNRADSVARLGWSRAPASAAVETYLPTIERPASAVGQSFGFLDFYNRVHIQFLALDLGNLVSDQSTTLWVWNAWRRAIILNTLTEDNAEGITLDGQPAPPLQFAPQQQRTYQLGISTDGPPTIDATLTWSFSTGQVLPVRITGSRVTGFSWSVDWGAGVLERLEWATDVLTSYRGEEQRRALRLGPRKALEFSVMASGNQRRILESALWNWGARVWAVPVWWDGTEATAPVNLGDTTVALDTTTRDFQPEGLAMLLGATAVDFEVAEVLAVNATSITLKRPTTRAWPTGTMVYPARAARLDPSVTLDRFTGDTSTARLRFLATEPDVWTASAGPATHRGYPVLEVRPNWTSEPQLALERKLNILDTVTGTRRVVDEAQQPNASQAMRWTFTSRAEIDAWRQRLHAMRGKHGAAWVPTWAQDLELVATVGDAELGISVAALGYTRYLQLDPNRRDIRVELANGAILYRRITGSTELSATVERLNIDAALGLTVQPSDVVAISWMMLARQESDAAELAWWTGEVVDAAGTFRSFRNQV